MEHARRWANDDPERRRVVALRVERDGRRLLEFVLLADTLTLRQRIRNGSPDIVHIIR